MKIDNECINHNALRLIEELVSTRYEYIDKPDDMKMVLGEIGGILEMARAMKKVLEA